MRLALIAGVFLLTASMGGFGGRGAQPRLEFIAIRRRLLWRIRG